MKKLLHSFIVAVMIISVVGCGGSSEATVGETETVKATTMVVTPTIVNEGITIQPHPVYEYHPKEKKNESVPSDHQPQQPHP